MANEEDEPVSLAHDANPVNWSGGLKAVAAVVAILGTLGAGSLTVGGKISDFSRVQTEMIDRIKGLSESLVQIHAEIASSAREQDVAREREIGSLQDQLRSVVAPRIDRVDVEVGKATSDLAAANARIDDMKNSLSEIHDDVKQSLSAAKENLSVSKSHDEDIHATRAAVAPKTQRPY